MRKVILGTMVVAAVCCAWYGFTIVTLPAPPSICAALSEEVDLSFTINKVNVSEIELLNSSAGKSTFVHFKMGKAWSKGRPGLEVTAMQNKSRLAQGGMTPDEYKQGNPGNKDFGQFMRDNRGQDVKEYILRHQLSEGDDGQTYMKMSYTGKKIPMLQVLAFDGPMQVPPHLASRFGVSGITFKSGSYYFDKEINGFWIPVDVDG